MFIFFQAEDGIRDIGVTGVQTCALPISIDVPAEVKPAKFGGAPAIRLTSRKSRLSSESGTSRRSEEGRVGKEWRFRWSAYHYKKHDLSYKHHVLHLSEGCYRPQPYHHRL